MIPGIAMNLGGTDYTVPPLNLRLYFAHEKEVQTLQEPAKVSPSDYVRAAIVVLLAVLQRNYPEMTQERLEDALDYPKLPQVIAAIFGQSGFTRPLAATATPSQSPEPALSASSSAQPAGSPTTS